ncbi:MAG: hypothetical protein J1E85_01925 [Ruminococcus sp.]|nr:hypothetical protein [Ruminococcus sp.]
MKKIISFSLCIALSALTLCACGDSTQMSSKENLSKNYTRSTDIGQTYNFKDGATDSPSSYNEFKNEITDFELKYFRNSFKENSDSMFVTAPVNIVAELGVLANGASKDSQTEIINALGDDINLTAINECMSYFMSRIQAVAEMESDKTDELTGKKITSNSTSYVKLKEALVFNDTLDVKSKFLQTNSDYYGLDIFRINFSDENSLQKLNNVFGEFSNKAVDSLDSENKLISVFGSDICDTWLNAYSQDDISEGIFKASSGDKTLNFMTSNESYMHTNTAQGVLKYTSKTPLKMLFIMPNEDTTLDEYISNFTSLEYQNLFTSIDITKKVTAKIPEFSIDSKNTATNITKAVSNSGLYTLFTEDSTFANLTNSTEFVFDNMFEISPKLTVNAAGIGGTSSNDATHILGKRTTELESTDTTVEFNRPFVFMVVDNETNIPIYMGTVDL